VNLLWNKGHYLSRWFHDEEQERRRKPHKAFISKVAEQDLLVHSEFRDGNVPASYEKVLVFREALEHLPEGVEKVYLRTDTAGFGTPL